MTSLFYDNRRLLLLSICLILVGGLSSFYVLPRMEDPVLLQRVAIINTIYPGASAERVEALVTEKIEEELQDIEEIKETRSSSNAGISTVTIELKDTVTEVAEVWSRIRDELEDAQVLLPGEVSDPDLELLDVSAYASILALVWDIPEPPNYAILRREAELLEDQLRAINGTRDVDVYGDPEEEIIVEIKQDELAVLGLTIDDVTRQIQSSDAKISAGVLRSMEGDLIVEVDTELTSLERIRRIPVVADTKDDDRGQFTVLGDIAKVEKSVVTPLKSQSLVDGRPAIALGSFVRNDYRVDYWMEDLNETLDAFQSQLPGGVRLKTVFEQNEYIESRLESLLLNLFLGASAVIAVVWVMMGWRSALIVGSALPLTSLMVLTGMRLLEMPMHQMSITGLIIALGLLIDNAIVMVDEVRDRISNGSSRRDAVTQSVRHLAIPLLSSTVTTALSFAPIALMPGPAGEFVGSIAISVILAIVSSWLVAMTITPSLMAILDRKQEVNQSRKWWSQGITLPNVNRLYHYSLGVLFNKPVVGILVGLLLPVAGFMGASTLTEQFFPPADRNQFHIDLTLSAQSSITNTIDVVQSARELLLENKDITDVEWFVGESAPPFYYNMLANREGTPQFAQALVQVKSAEKVRDVIRNVQVQLDSAFPDAQILVRQLEQGPPFEAPIEMRLYGPDLEILRKLGDQIRVVMSSTHDILHTTASMANIQPKLAIQIDEDNARLAGLNHSSIARQLYSVLEGTEGGTLLETTEELPVRVRVDHSRRGQLNEIASVDLIPENSADMLGQQVPLSSFAGVTLQPEVSGDSAF